jgi:hypothetical protein
MLMTATNAVRVPILPKAPQKAVEDRINKTAMINSAHGRSTESGATAQRGTPKVAILDRVVGRLQNFRNAATENIPARANLRTSATACIPENRPGYACGLRTRMGLLIKEGAPCAEGREFNEKCKSFSFIDAVAQPSGKGAGL